LYFKTITARNLKEPLVSHSCLVILQALKKHFNTYMVDYSTIQNDY